MSKCKLFISHAAADRRVAQAVSEILQAGLSLKAADISCTSLAAEGLPMEGDFLGFVERQLNEADAVVVILSHNYFSNRFCLCELGASWALSRHLVPLVVPPLRRKHVSEIFAARELRKIDDTDHLNRVAADLQEALGLSLNLQRWAMEKKRFLSELPGLIEESGADKGK